MTEKPFRYGCDEENCDFETTDQREFRLHQRSHEEKVVPLSERREKMYNGGLRM